VITPDVEWMENAISIIDGAVDWKSIEKDQLGKQLAFTKSR
jgi:hypothetical protein